MKTLTSSVPELLANYSAACERFTSLRTSKLAPIFEAPSPTTVLQGVCADPPSLYLWAFGALTGRRLTYFWACGCEGSAHEDRAGHDAAATAFRDPPPLPRHSRMAQCQHRFR
jgi:hypothetical protein